jgi:hypothetical protein
VAPHFQISVYHEDGVFDRGPTLEDARGARAIAAFIQRRSAPQPFAAGWPISADCLLSTCAATPP